MPINIGKNLKIEPTNDTKVSKFVRNYNQIHDYFTEKYSNPKYYAYVYPTGRNLGSSSQDAIIVYSTKELTSSSGESTGSQEFFYTTYYISPYGDRHGTCIMTSASEVESSNTFTGNITEFYDNGYKDSLFRAIRCPNLDIYDDGSIGNGEPYMYAYISKDEETGEYYTPVFYPRPFNDIVGFYQFQLYEYEGSTITYYALDEFGQWSSNSYEMMEELPDGTFRSNIYSDIIMTRFPEHDLTNLGPSRDVKLYNLLMSLLPSAVISYSNLPSGATFKWYLDELHEQEIPNPYKAKEGQKIYYSLKYADGSICDDEFTVSGDTELDLSTLEPNLFRITVTANKPLSYVRVHQSGYYDYSVPPDSNNNVYVLCEKNKSVTLSAKCAGWTEIDKITDDQNPNYCKHNYTNVTQNISETYEFNYVAYDSIKIFLKDENNNYIDLTDDPWLNYITYTPSDATKFNPIGIIQGTGTNPKDYYNAYKDTSISVDYSIDVPNYAPITGTFAATSATPTQYYEQTKTLVPLVTYTIVPYPNDAIVTLAASGYTQSGNSITVPKGTNVVWMVAKQDYQTQSGNVVVNSTQSVNVVLEESYVYGVDVADYQYTNINQHVELTKYIGAGGNIVTPGLEEIIE